MDGWVRVRNRGEHGELSLFRASEKGQEGDRACHVCPRELIAVKHVVCVAAARFDDDAVRRALARAIQESRVESARVHFLLALPPESQAGALAQLNALETMAAAQMSPPRSVLKRVDVIHSDDIGVFKPRDCGSDDDGGGCAWWLNNACREHFNHSHANANASVKVSDAAVVEEYFGQGLLGTRLTETDWSDLGRPRVARIKDLLGFYGWIAQVLERQHDVHRATVELWPYSSCFHGSTSIPGSIACHHGTLSVDDSISVRVAITAAPRATIASLPPDALERVISYFLFEHSASQHTMSCIRNLRRCITSCKALACAVKNVTMRSMRIVPTPSEGGDAARGAASTDESLASVAEASLEGIDLTRLSLAHFQRALDNLSSTLVTLGIPQRLVWRAKHHKARGNRELANSNYARALGHYALVFHKCLGVPDADPGCSARLERVIPPEFDFQGCVDHDANMLFANAGVDHVRVLDEWDARVGHGKTSRAAAALNLIVVQSLVDAAFCLLKMNEPRVALLLATRARDGIPRTLGPDCLGDKCIVHRPWRTGTTSKARVYRIRAELRMVQALRGMGQCSDAKVICVRALNRFRGDPASGRQFRDELKLCVEEQVIIFPKVLEEKVMGVN